VDGGGACECASRVAAGHEADAQGGESIEAGADDNAPYDFRKSFKDAGHKDSLSADHSEFFSRRDCPSAESFGVSAVAETMIKAEIVILSDRNSLYDKVLQQQLSCFRRSHKG
jgi:hypothetical protein